MSIATILSKTFKNQFLFLSAIPHNWSFFTIFKQTFWSILGYHTTLKEHKTFSNGNHVNVYCFQTVFSLSLQFALLLRGSASFRLHLPITIGSLPSQSRRSSAKSSGSTASPSVSFIGFPSTSMDYNDGMASYPNEGQLSYRYNSNTHSRASRSLPSNAEAIWARHAFFPLQ